jgi:hypothetical protein
MCRTSLGPNHPSFQQVSSILFPMPPHVHIDFVVPPPGCGWSVTDFWGWGAHRAQLRCPDDMSYDDICERGVPEGALNLSSASYPGHAYCGSLPLQGKIPTAEQGIEPGSSWLVVRSSDHQTTTMDVSNIINLGQCCRNIVLSNYIQVLCVCVCLGVCKEGVGFCIICSNVPS